MPIRSERLAAAGGKPAAFIISRNLTLAAYSCTWRIRSSASGATPAASTFLQSAGCAKQSNEAKLQRKPLGALHVG
jgi:hypothetical protein